MPEKTWIIPEIRGNPRNLPVSNQAPFRSSPIKGAENYCPIKGVQIGFRVKPYGMPMGCLLGCLWDA